MEERGNGRSEVRSAWDEDGNEDTSAASAASAGSNVTSPVRQSSSNAVHERRIVDEGEDLSEDEVFSQVFRSRDPKELMFLALLEREFLKLLEKPIEDRYVDIEQNYVIVSVVPHPVLIHRRLKTQLKFPPMNGWYRLLIHKTAARFRMKSVSDGDGPERSATVSVSPHRYIQSTPTCMSIRVDQHISSCL